VDFHAGFLSCFLIWECLFIVNLSKRSKKIDKCERHPDLRYYILALQGSRKGEEEHTHRHTLKAHVEEERTRARSTYAEEEGLERIKERRNGGRVIGGRGKMGRSRVGGKGGRTM